MSSWPGVVDGDGAADAIAAAAVAVAVTGFAVGKVVVAVVVAVDVVNLAAGTADVAAVDVEIAKLTHRHSNCQPTTVLPHRCPLTPSGPTC